MAVYELRSVQKIPITVAEAWAFFSHPKNLFPLTPPALNLKFTNELYGTDMYPGQIITYTIKPLLGLPLFWMTEITHMEPQCFFVDEQRLGPYALWHHQHHFKAISGGVEMTDIVHYKIPFAWLGTIAHQLFVKKQLYHIFRYRYEKIIELFGPWPQAHPMQVSIK